MLETRIVGDLGDRADVQERSILVSPLPYPPIDVPNKVIPFIGNMTINGDTVTTDLNVDGSTTPIDAFIGPPVSGDLYLTTVNILIADGGTVSLNRFGGINNGLTTGVKFFVQTENEKIDISPNLKTNFDLIRIGTLTQGTGGKTDAYLLANANTSNNDGYNIVIDLKRISSGGIRMRKDTLDQLGMTINDDLTSVATFDILVSGFIRI